MKALRSPLLWIAILCTVPFLVGTGSEFWGDDRFLIFQRLEPGSGASPLEFFHQDYWMGVEESGLYRPVGLSFLLAERALFGTWEPAYRAVSLLLHFLACVLLWRVFAQLVGLRAATVGALIFACHPIHAEAVLPVYGQLDLLAAALLAAALLARRAGRHWTGAAALGLALLCKESAIAAPLLMLWLAWTAARRVTAAELPYWPVLGAVLALRIAVLGTVGLSREATVLGTGGIGLWANSVIVTVGHAIRLCVWPTGQTVYYGHLRDSLRGVPVVEALWICAGIALVWLLAGWLPKDSTAVAAGWFAICLLPVANVVPIGVLVAERTLYLPSAGIAALAGLCWVKAAGEGRRWVHGALLVALLVGCAASARTAWRWRTELSLWSSTVADHPRSPKAHAMLGHALLREADKGRADAPALLRQADLSFSEALRLNPGSVDALYGRGLVLSRDGSCAEAMPYLRDAARLRAFDQEIELALRRCGQ
uniref:Glycosyltransferase RgtA/B/C/D-like domain-containing protein n=1 Tax=Solibacter usitatus (strain Ellin6076) TaxID=234267 RepID=Q020J9_SOLUE